DENTRGFISMLDTPKQIEKKIKSATTDSESVVKFDKENKPGISNLLTILSSCTNKSIPELEIEFENSDYTDYKSAVAEAVHKLLDPIQDTYNELIESDEIDQILDLRKTKATKHANITLEKSKKGIGLKR